MKKSIFYTLFCMIALLGKIATSPAVEPPDQITIISPSGDFQAIVIDSTAANTSIDGIIDLNVNFGNVTNTEAINIDLKVNDGATAGNKFRGVDMDLTANDADANVTGIRIQGLASANAAAGSFEAGILINNAEDTAASMTDALIVTTTGATNSAITDALDVSNSNIDNAINIGANKIIGTGGATLDIAGTGDQTLTFTNSTGGGTIVLDMVTNSVDLRIPGSSPSNDGNGLYYNTTANTLCVDDSDGTDRCTAALTLEQAKHLGEILQNPTIIQTLSDLSATHRSLSDTKNISHLLDLSPSQLGHLSYLVQKLNTTHPAEGTAFHENALSKIVKDAIEVSDDLLVEGHIFQILENEIDEKRVAPISVGTQPFIFDRGEAQLINGHATIYLEPTFLGVANVNDEYPIQVQITPTSTDLQGTLVVSRRERTYFVVEELRGKSNATFSWEVAAYQKGEPLEKLPTLENYRKRILERE